MPQVFKTYDYLEMICMLKLQVVILPLLFVADSAGALSQQGQL